MRMLESSNTVEVRAEQSHAKLIFAAEGKVVIRGETADGPERHSLAVNILRLIAARVPGLRSSRSAGITDSESAHAIRGCEIAFEQRRRNVEKISNVIESESRVVRKQQRFNVNMQVQ
jgi:hypothetical protein